MAAKFHVNGKGEAGKCSASNGKCPFGGETGTENHYDTVEQAQAAAEKLLEAGIIDFTLNAGGDILISDGQSREDFWRVAISRPVSIADAEAGVLTVLDLTGTDFRAVATSGSAERGQHIWNPKSSENQQDFTQVSVIAKDIVEADVWATAAFAEGIRSLERINKQAHLEALYVMADGSLQATDGVLALLAKATR